MGVGYAGGILSETELRERASLRLHMPHTRQNLSNRAKTMILPPSTASARNYEPFP